MAATATLWHSIEKEISIKIIRRIQSVKAVWFISFRSFCQQNKQNVYQFVTELHWY